MKCLLLCLALTALACHDDIQLLDPKPVAPRAYLSFGVQHDSQTHRDVYAVLHTGRARDGYAVPVVDSSMFVNGEKVLPEAFSGNGAGFLYHWTPVPTAPGGIPDSLAALMPRVDVPGSDSLRITAKLPARLGAYDIVLLPGEDLHLRITPGSQVSLPSIPGQAWRAEIRSSCNSGSAVVQLTGTNSYPDSLTFSRAQLPSTGPFEACLIVSQIYTGATQPYEVFVSVNAMVRWRVQYAP